MELSSTFTRYKSKIIIFSPERKFYIIISTFVYLFVHNLSTQVDIFWNSIKQTTNRIDNC